MCNVDKTTHYDLKMGQAKVYHAKNPVILLVRVGLATSIVVAARTAWNLQSSTSILLLGGQCSCSKPTARTTTTVVDVEEAISAVLQGGTPVADVEHVISAVLSNHQQTPSSPSSSSRQNVKRVPPPIVFPRNKTQACAAAILTPKWTANSHSDQLLQLKPNPQCASAGHLDLSPLQPKQHKVLTYLLLYYDAPYLLKRQMDSWKKFTNLKDIQFLIVDDGSEIRAADVVSNYYKNNSFLELDLDIAVYEIDQDLDWNIGGARNLGFAMAPPGWVFLNDADIIVPPDLMEYARTLALSSPHNVIYREFQRVQETSGTVKPHPGAMLSTTQTYWQVGGCDEDFVGNYGQSDPHMYWRIRQSHNIKIKQAFRAMNKKKIPPLVEVDDSGPPATHKPKLSKDVGPNEIKFNKKKKKGQWSDQYLRFTWRRVW